MNTEPEQQPLTAERLDEALATGRQHLDEEPELALDSAMRVLETTHDSRAYRLAALAYRKLGRVEDAEHAERAGIQAGFTERRLREALRAEQDGQSAIAGGIAAEYLEKQPDDLLAHLVAAEAAINLRNLESAEQHLRVVEERAPNFGRTTLLLARCRMLQCRLSEAIGLLSELIREKGSNKPALTLLAEVMTEARRYDEAAALYEELVAAAGDRVTLWWSYANALRILGKKHHSEQALRKALEIDPANGSAWWSLVDLLGKPLSPDDSTALASALEARGSNPVDGYRLHAAQASTMEREERYAEAFRHFAAANDARSRVEPYDPDVTTRSVDRAIELFDDSFHRAKASAGAADDSPIFIVGLPRSGSTLLERIIGRHSKVEAAGELPVLGRLLDALNRRSGGDGRYHDQVAGLSAEEIRELGERYVELSLEYRRTAKPRFTDKMPHNWRYVDTIRLALRNARIIDVRRDAVDCCWSNYKMVYGAGHGAANDLTHIGRFYKDCVRMLDHFETVAPEAILRVRYEDLVDDIEREVRRVLGFLDLEYESGCIDFHLEDRPVATASSQQVRRPLNRDGIGAWKPYEPWLAPLL